MKCLNKILKYIVIINTRQRNKLHVTKFRLNITLKHVSYLGVVLWNAILDKTDINCSIVTFKQRVKRFLLCDDLL